MLLSVVNTKLRDCYPSLEKLCEDMGQEEQELVQKLQGIDYQYDPDRNQFV